MNGAFNNEYTEYKSQNDPNTLIKQYFEMFRPYLGDMIDKFRKSGKWKI